MFSHKVTKKQLNNNSQVVEVVIPHIPYTVVGIHFHAGSRFDPKGKEGLAHLTEHILSPYVGTTTQRVEKLEAQGISTFAETNAELAWYYHVQLPDVLEFSTRELLSYIKLQQVDDVFFNKEKNVILQEVAANYEQEDALLWRQNNQQLFPEHGLGNDIFGTSTSIEHCSQVDIQNFYQKQYTKPFVAVVILPKARSDIFDIFEQYPTQISKHENKESIFPPKQKKILTHTNATTSHIAVGFQTVSITQKKETAALLLLNHYIANTWSSVLNKKLRREEQLVYWVESEVAHFSDTGLFRIATACDPSMQEKVLEIIQSELQHLTITNDQFAALSTSFLSALVQDLYSPERLAWWYGWHTALGSSFETVDDVITAVKQLSATDLLEVAKKYVTKEREAITIVRP